MFVVVQKIEHVIQQRLHLFGFQLKRRRLMMMFDQLFFDARKLRREQIDNVNVQSTNGQIFLLNLFGGKRVRALMFVEGKIL